MTTPPGMLKGRPFKGRLNHVIIRSEDVTCLILASKIRTEVFFTNYHNEIPKSTRGVLARTISKGMLKVIGPASAKAALRRLFPRDHLVRIAPGIYVNPDFVTALPDPREKRRIVTLEINGETEGFVMSRRGEADLGAALRDRYWPPFNSPPPSTTPEFRPFE